MIPTLNGNTHAGRFGRLLALPVLRARQRGCVGLEAALSCGFKNGTSFEQSCEVGTSTSRSACRLPAAMHRVALNPETEFSPLTW
jgi:hypothetical protein